MLNYPGGYQSVNIGLVSRVQDIRKGKLKLFICTWQDKQDTGHTDAIDTLFFPLVSLQFGKNSDVTTIKTTTSPVTTMKQQSEAQLQGIETDIYPDWETEGSNTPSLAELDDKQQCFLFLTPSNCQRTLTAFEIWNPPQTPAVRRTEAGSAYSEPQNPLIIPQHDEKVEEGIHLYYRTKTHSTD